MHMSTVMCPVCPHACQLKNGEMGLCGARQAQVGRVASLSYGCCTALSLDPIEKKPLGRFYPGSKILSYGSFGCNLACDFCQNWEIAHRARGLEALEQIKEMSRFVSPDELVKQAVALKAKGNIGIALTYNEPLICPEYLIDVAELAHAQDLKLVLVTNGYVMPSIAKQVFAYVDAANIDLKAFSQDFYTMVGAPAGLATVKRTIQIAIEAGCHVEVTTLVIPELNDSPEEIDKEAAWLASLSPDTPLHLSRFIPAYKMMDKEATPHSTILELARVAYRYLTHIYTGNMHTKRNSNSHT